MKKIPHTFTIVFALILLAAVCTWIVPAGEFVRESVTIQNADGTTSVKEVVQNNSFRYVERNPQTWQVFSALFDGFVDKADIIIFILMVGGAFNILNNSRAIEVGVMAFLRRVLKLNRFKLFKKLGVENIIITLIMIMFSLFGAVFGMSEEIGIAQGIADLPIFSGLEYRFLCWIILTIIGIAFVLWYANRVKSHPEKSPTFKLDNYWRQRSEEQQQSPVVYSTPRVAWILFVLLSIVMAFCAFTMPSTIISVGGGEAALPLMPILAALFLVTGIVTLRKSVHFFILDILLFTICFLIVGVLGYGWYVKEISALFLAMGICSGIADKQSADSIAKLFLAGCKDILSAALVVGLASGIIFILRDGKIIDTLLYALTRSLAESGDVASVGVMYVFQTLLNLIMPSGSAKAALTMPIMAQFSDLIGVSRQTAVLAFQFGDGFTNMLTPTSGVLIAVLGVAKIPYATWVKWVWKFILALIVIGFFLLLPTIFIHFPGF